jgi:hypothetical protein
MKKKFILAYVFAKKLLKHVVKLGPAFGCSFVRKSIAVKKIEKVEEDPHV